MRTLASGVEAVRSAGLACEPIDPAIEAVAMDDHRARSQKAAGERAFAVWAERAPLEVADFAAVLEAVRADVVLVDTTTFGAKAVAEREGLPWAESRPFLLEDPAPGVPPLRLWPGAQGRPARQAARRLLGLATSRVRRALAARRPSTPAGSGRTAVR